MKSTNTIGSSSDFDFLVGTWSVQHQRLKERLKDSDSWEVFEGTCICRTILKGIGNIDENILHRGPDTLEAITLRLFNIESKQWSIYWADKKRGILETPLIGGFSNATGEFYSQEIFEGRYIYNRFIWKQITNDLCRWEQAYSDNGGMDWETNWKMEFTRKF